ncbi:MAG: hypothetical protein AOY29_06775 [Alcanivorax borkumensis]|uniref:DUF306 domain-containing protein n=1 Tax=Alcanivorax borkumensis (strain ATCC 700651 / DSM 11573 / NCIMB 13689 / SK2) TaxID=393595 RepID=Q0VL89_ALCBS|nr:MULTISPECIES: META domain-containing protein [Alcanivorax]EUC70914.1 hypothetical protein Y017_08015 [Alcanivorax sp. 97CO-5]OJH06599.1 MAG: hypothetical protein AOY29_06775 [Alcanivorax borkumensis]CAL18059.1 hypothetical protein ABO_2611 [Alcanivorax borkumensis SK2]
MSRFRLPLLLSSSALLLAACTGQPSSGVHTMVEESQLRGEAWSVISLNGENITDATLSLNFHQPGQVAGNAGCNNYMATYVQNEGLFTITTGGVTMMACPKPLMELEQKFLNTLGDISQARINADGILVLSGKDGEKIKATR